MVRVRKLVLAIAAASALSSGMAHALGLGEPLAISAAHGEYVSDLMDLAWINRHFVFVCQCIGVDRADSYCNC